MPVYEYRCKDCRRTHEIEHGFHDERPTSCPTCGGDLVRIFHPVGLVFKGSGFHRTDYKKAATPESAGSDSKAAEPKPADKKGADVKPVESKKPATDTKPKG